MLVLIVLLVMAVTTAYVSREHEFYYWDHASYHDLSEAEALSLRELSHQPLRAMLRLPLTIRRSTGYRYSDLHTLPIAPFILLFGGSRGVYIRALGLVYLLPYTIIMGAIGARLVPTRARVAFWSTILLSLCLPATWLPTLRGFPDTGGAALVGIAALLYLDDSRDRRWWRIPLIGISLALAALFRRYFLYSAGAFFVAISVQTL